MSITDNILSKTQGTSNKNRTPFQPSYPLSYDQRHGPWKPLLTVEESINQDFKFLLLTEPGEWPMNPDLGVGLKRYLFEFYRSPSLQGLKSRIQDQISKHLPRVSLISAEFESSNEDKDRNTIVLRIRYTILAATEIISKIILTEKGYLLMETEYIKRHGEIVMDLIPLTSKIKQI